LFYFTGTSQPTSMFKNYLKIAWRNLWKNKTFSAINILGLSVGIACALMIIFHVKGELSYDRGYSKSDRIYRITQEDIGGNARHWAATPPPLGIAIQQDLPEIEHSARFHRPYPYMVFSYTRPDNIIKSFEEKGGFFADPAVVDLFDLVFTRGNAKTALSETDAIVLTEETAKKYFGNEDPLDKIIRDDITKLPLKVTGVLKKTPFPTHLRFDYLLSMATITKYQDKESMERRTWSGFYTYVLLKKGQSEKTIESKIPGFMTKFYAENGKSSQEILSSRKLHFQPITDIHLHSKLEKEMYPNSDVAYVYIFSIVALFILLITAVNFINIFTAQAFNRMKEIGLRKVVGASRRQLIRQFLGESILITLLATLLSLGLFKAGLPVYEDLTAQSLHTDQILTLPNLGLLLILIISIGLLAGFYPAWFVSNFNPITSLKAKKITGSSVTLVRKSLIVFQFVISVFMIFGTITIYRQMKFFHNKDLGFDKEQVVAMTIYGEMWQKFGALINDIRKNNGIANYSIISTLPGDRFSVEPFIPLGSSDDDLPGMRVMWADEKLVSTLQIPLKEGRDFFNQFPDIKNQEFILNEAAVKALNLKDPVGKSFVLQRDTGTIVGVVKDFNFASLHAGIEPLVIHYNPYRANYLLLKVKPNHLPGALQTLESNAKSLYPSSPFTYSFIDEKIDRLYESENKMSQVFKIFAAFAIFISCLGLFGISAYVAQLRIKEVGIRKVLGASTSHVAILLSKDYMVLVAVATLISWPLAWFVMNRWLSSFAYHVSIGGWVFVISGLSAFLVALMTVSFQAIKTAVHNPAHSLKSE
jgi:putative ABC transport system permease protein